MRTATLITLLTLAACGPTRLEQQRAAENRATLNQWAATCSQYGPEKSDIFERCIGYHFVQWKAQKELEAGLAATYADPGIYIDDGITVAPVYPAPQQMPQTIILQRGW